MRKFLLLFHTLKYLKGSQFYFRIHRKLFKPKITEAFHGDCRSYNNSWIDMVLFGEEKIAVCLEATFLNYHQKLTFPQDWNSESHSKLWTYNLHYFEDLLAINASEKKQFHIELLNTWIDQNPVGAGNGWEPYPTSLRISNVLKAWLSGLKLEKKHFNSLYAQASYLSNDLEKHLLGNHYFVNLKALLFAGVILRNNRWLTIAVSGLLDEIPEQILSDGANFELSPMYHSLILVDMLDMYNLSNAYPNHIPSALISHLKTYIPKMIRFMLLMTHNDEGVSFFNDSVDGIAPSKCRIETYAKRLGFEWEALAVDQLQAIDSKASGYMVATSNGNKLIFDAANVGPDYIPGHAHADTLSFELSIGDERVFVNTGTSQYGLSDKRFNERKTSSHNTVEVDKRDSSQVWSGFRVAKRARVTDRSCAVFNNTAILSATHTGYKTLFGGALHTRNLQFSGNKLIVVDTIKGRFTQAIARFYIHPELDVRLEEGKLIVDGKNFVLKADVNKKNARLVNSEWHPGFGLSESNKCLEITFSNAKLATEFTWITQ